MHSTNNNISDLQIGVRGRRRVRVLSSEKLVLVVVLVLQSEGRYCSFKNNPASSRTICHIRSKNKNLKTLSKAPSMVCHNLFASPVMSFFTIQVKLYLASLGSPLLRVQVKLYLAFLGSPLLRVQGNFRYIRGVRKLS